MQTFVWTHNAGGSSLSLTASSIVFLSFSSLGVEQIEYPPTVDSSGMKKSTLAKKKKKKKKKQQCNILASITDNTATSNAIKELTGHNRFVWRGPTLSGVAGVIKNTYYFMNITDRNLLALKFDDIVII